MCEQRKNLTPQIPLGKIPSLILDSNRTNDDDTNALVSGLTANRKTQAELAEGLSFFSTQNRNHKRGATWSPEYSTKYNLRSKEVNASTGTLDQESSSEYSLINDHPEDPDDQTFKQSLSEITGPSANGLK